MSSRWLPQQEASMDNRSPIKVDDLMTYLHHATCDASFIKIELNFHEWIWFKFLTDSSGVHNLPCFNIFTRPPVSPSVSHILLICFPQNSPAISKSMTFIFSFLALSTFDPQKFSLFPNFWRLFHIYTRPSGCVK